MTRPRMTDRVNRAVRANFDRSVRGYETFEAQTGRFEALARRLRDAMADRGATFDAVLDAGAGSGISTAVFEEAGDVVALDASRGMLRANPASRRVQADLEALPLADGRFDVVAFTASLFLAGDPGRAVREAERVLVAGGHVGALAPIGWFTGDADVFDGLPRESRTPHAADDVNRALQERFDVESGVWSFPSSADDLLAFFEMPAAAAQLYPKDPPEERLAKVRELLDGVEGPLEHRWRWYVAR